MAKGNTPKPVSRILKEYKYAVNGITLDFSLYIDETAGLVSFAELLKQATAEVAEDLKNVQVARKAKAKGRK